MHPLTQHVPLYVLARLDEKRRRQVPFATVVTDLGSAHRTWFDKRVDACFVPSDAVRQLAGRCGLRCGARGAQVRQYGLPVRPAFWTAAAERKQRLSAGSTAAVSSVSSHRWL